MSKLEWFVGVDWASRTHQVCILDVSGEVRGERTFEHTGAGLAAMADWILCRAGGSPAEAVGAAIETPRGPVVESLIGRGFAVHSINPKQLDRFRDRYSPAGAKDDRLDALVLASALRTDAHCLRRIEATDPGIVELREWSRIAEDLKRERARLSNRMREQLWRYYPQFIHAVDEVTAPWALALWKRLPTPAAARGVRQSTLDKLLKKHRIRRIDAANLKARLQVRAMAIAPATIRASEAHVRILSKRLALVNDQLAEAQARLEALVAQLAEAVPEPTAAAGEHEPGQAKEPRDATILRSLPGVGTVVLATLFAEADDALRRRDYRAALPVRCGTRHQEIRQEQDRRAPARRPRSPARCRLPLGPGRRAARPGLGAKYDALRARGGHDRRTSCCAPERSSTPNAPRPERPDARVQLATGHQARPTPPHCASKKGSNATTRTGPPRIRRTNPTPDHSRAQKRTCPMVGSPRHPEKPRKR